jgi:hypothetical protein
VDALKLIAAPDRRAMLLAARRFSVALSISRVLFGSSPRKIHQSRVQTITVKVSNFVSGAWRGAEEGSCDKRVDMKRSALPVDHKPHTRITLRTELLTHFASSVAAPIRVN